MDTLVIKDKALIQKAGEIIRDGGVVAFPTETVYGLGASALDDSAVKKIYEAKGRPSDNPLIVHIADICDVYKVAREVPDNAKKLLDAFCPGPITLILKKNPEISDTVTAGLDTVGVRIPAHPVAREFLRACSVPIAAPSANLSGKPSPTHAEHVIKDMTGRVDAIICGGVSDVGVESTIVDMTGDIPTILRPGGITKAQLLEVLGEVKIDRHIVESVMANEQPKCPGMKYKHYSPDCEVVVVEGERAKAKIKELVKSERAKDRRVGVLVYEDADIEADSLKVSGKSNKGLAGVLFDTLRSFDDDKIDIAFVEFLDDDEMGLAVKNRLYKAAGNNVIYV